MLTMQDAKRRLPLLAGISAAGLLLAAPLEAQAKNEFERGFKDELGRVAAHEAVGVGRGVLAGILLGGYPGYYGGYDYPTHRPRYYDDYDRGGWRHYRPRYHRGGWYDHRPHWRPRGHGWGHPRHRGGWGHHRRHVHHHYHGCGH